METSYDSLPSNLKTILHWSLIRMEQYPFFEPWRCSNLLDGGTLKSSSVIEASINRSFIRARFWISRGSRLDLSWWKIFSVSASPKDRIIEIIYAIRIYLSSRYNSYYGKSVTKTYITMLSLLELWHERILYSVNFNTSLSLIHNYWLRTYIFLYIMSLSNVRLTSEPQLGAEFAHTSEASRKLRDNRRVWLKRLLGCYIILNFILIF